MCGKFTWKYWLNNALSGAGGRSRTRDPVITNHVLYQLSYAGLIGLK